MAIRRRYRVVTFRFCQLGKDPFERKTQRVGMEAKEIKEPLALQGAINNYAWGKLGTESKACEFYTYNHPEFVPENTTPYAELWLGSHPNGPSVIKKTGEVLGDVLNKHPEILGDVELKRFGSKLPFLLKILSIASPLSIQAHPDKALAEHLHKLKPEIYKDDNHKPEMAIALSDNFVAMCGFRPKEDLVKCIQSVPEIDPLLPEDAVNILMKADNETLKKELKDIFSQMINVPKDLVRQQVTKLKERLAKCCSCSTLQAIVNCIVSEYPEDAGVFSPYLLNVLHLKEGEAIFIPANEPHAYISGDCVECMAASDNVVRAGLTNKLIDKDTLVNMLSYESREPNKVKINSVKETDFSVLFRPPVEDFAVAVVDIPPRTVEIKLPGRQSVSLLMIVEGDAKGNNNICLRKGEAYMLPANFEITVSQLEHNPRLHMFQAFVNL